MFFFFLNNAYESFSQRSSPLLYKCVNQLDCFKYFFKKVCRDNSLNYFNIFNFGHLSNYYKFYMSHFAYYLF